MAKSGQIGYIDDMATQERPPDYQSQARIEQKDAGILPSGSLFTIAPPIGNDTVRAHLRTQRNIDQCAKAIGKQCSVIYLGFAKYGVKYFTWVDK